MAIKILEAKYKYDRDPGPGYYDCDILADTEADITSLGEIVDDGRLVVKPFPGSKAATADGAHKYILSPSNVWTKVGG